MKDILQIKITYKHIQQVQIKNQLTPNKYTQFTLNYLLQKINTFIEEKQIDASQFLQIFINVKNGYKNIYHIFQNQDSCQIQLPRIDNKFHMHIELRDLEKNQEQKDYITDWQKDIDNFIEKQTNIRNEIKEKQKTFLQQENKNLIDLAFFYSQPLVHLLNQKQKAVGKEVGYQKQTVRFKNMLQKKGLKRDIHIHIDVATQSNILKALASRINILHFSCHGDKSYLQLEDQKNLGMLYKCSAQNLIKLLSENLPLIIFFNACQSDEIAKKIFEKFQIITIGYQGKSNDLECTQFTQLFYNDIFFNQNSIVKAFENARSRLQKNKNKLKIYCNNDISIKPPKYGSNLQSLIAIDNKQEPMQEDLFSINLELYSFINQYFTSMNKEIIPFNGEQKSGKSLFVKKACLYLKQRGRIDNHLIINLRQDSNLRRYIGSMSEFRIEYSDTIQKFIQQNKNKNIILVLDHCDILIMLQKKQFQHQINKYLNNIRGKIILIYQKGSKANYQKQHFVLDFDVFKEFFIHKKEQLKKKSSQNLQFKQFSWSKAPKDFVKKLKSHKYKPYQHQQAIKYILQNNLDLDQYFNKLQKLKAQQDSKNIKQKQYINRTITINMRAIKQFTKDYCKQLQSIIQYDQVKCSLTQHPIIDFMIEIKQKNKKQQILQLPVLSMKKTASNRFSRIDDKMQENFRQIYQKILNKIEFVINHIDNGGILQRQNKLKIILRSINCLINFKYLISKEVFYKQNKILCNFIKTIDKCISLCLILIHKLKEDKSCRNIVLQFQTLMQKLLIFLVITTINDESWNYSIKKHSIYRQSLYQVVSNNNKINIIESLLFIYEQYILEIEPDIIHDIDMESDLYKYDKIKLFFDKYQILKKNLDKNFQNTLDRDNWQEEYDQLKTQQKLYGIQQLKQIGLVFIKLAKGFLKYRTNELSFQKKAYSIKDMLFQCQFLFQQNHNLKKFYQLKNYKRQYISLLFSLQKILIKNRSQSKKYTRVQIIGKFNRLIHQCKKQDFKELQLQIQRYKSESFNSCAALTSFPLAYKQIKVKDIKQYEKKNGFLQNINSIPYILINPWRFSSKLDDFITTSFQRIKKTIFTRVDCLSKKIISKYKQDNLPILLSYFFVDCKNTTNQQQCILYLEDDNGLSDPINIQDLQFFHSYISVFCGNHVQKIHNYFQKYKKDDNKIYIFLNSSHRDLGEDHQSRYLQIYWSIRNKILIYSIFEYFIYSFCEQMFSYQHSNFLYQINSAFNLGKENARIRTKMEYGNIFQKQIDKFIQNITILNNTRQNKQVQPPLKISEREKKFAKEQKISKQVSHFRYNCELIKALEYLQDFRKDDYGTKFMIISSFQRKSNKEFLDCLKSKVKKMGIFANGIVSKDQSDKRYIQQNTCASSISYKKIRLQDDIMQVYQQKSRKQILSKIRQQKEASSQEGGNQKENRVILFTTSQEDKQFPIQAAFLRLELYSEFNIIVWALHELFLRIKNLNNIKQKQSTIVSNLIKEIKGVTKHDKINKIVYKHLQKFK